MLKKLTKKAGKPAKNEEAEMGFLDHLDELRSHLIKSLLAIVVCAIVIFTLEDWVFRNIIFSLKSDSFLTYRFFCSLGEQFCLSAPEFVIETKKLGEQFFVSLRVSFWLGFIVAFPYVFYQIWSFVKPGLYEKEQKAARGVVFVCSFLFLLGVLFGYFILAPFAIRFFAGYQLAGNLVSETTHLSDFVGSLTMFTIPTGILFELPILVYFLAKIGLVTPELMRNYRKHAFVLILIVAAIITPPDVITQFLIGMPIFFLYEVSILIAARITKKREKELNS